MKARAHLSEMNERSCRCSNLTFCSTENTHFFFFPTHASSARFLCAALLFYKRRAKAAAAAQAVQLQPISAAPSAFTEKHKRGKQKGEVMLLDGVWREDGDSPLWLLSYVIPPGFPLPSCSTVMPSGRSEIRLPPECSPIIRRK